MTGKRMVVQLGLVFFALAAIAGTYSEYHAHRSSTAHMPMASFIALGSAATAWRQGPSRADSTVLFRKASDCFIEVNRLAGSYNLQPELQRYVRDPKTTQLAVTKLVLHGQHEDYAFILHRFKIDDTSPNAVYPSQQVGIVDVPNGVIRINGYCAAPADEPALIDALGEIRLLDR